MTILLTKLLKDGRTLEISYSGNLLNVTVAINGSRICNGPIDRRNNPASIARMIKLPAEIAAVICGKVALTNDDLAAIDLAASNSTYAAAARAAVARVMIGVNLDIASERAMAIVECPTR